MLEPETMHSYASRLHLKGVPVLPRMLEGFIFLMCNCVLPASASIGAHTKFAYRGLGTVVHARAVVGRNVMIGPGVVIGGKSGHYDVPVIEDDCFIGAGAKILGPIVVGAGSVVGANAVVVRDVPERCLVAGVPARVIRRDIQVRDYGELPIPADTAGVS